MASGTTKNGVTRKTLSNGLTVLLKEDRSNPVVAINVWFGVGSVNETDEATGLAHFQEHMVFKGTERHGVGEIANIIKAAGGNLNAATSYSYTMYYVVLPSHAFSLGLDVQADAMMNSTFDAEEFQKERLVVIDEARMYDDTPDAFVFYRMMELGYKVHNYRRPIAGYEKIVREFSRDQLLEFYNRYYRPANAVLAIVGDVNPDSAMAEIEKVYGGWKNGSVDVHQSPEEPAQGSLRFQSKRGTIDHSYLGIGFHVPSTLDPDYPALEMLSALLGSGKSSRLHRKVIEEKHLATTAHSTLLAERWPGYFMVFASTSGDGWGEGSEAVFEELLCFQHEPVEAEELLKARRQVEKAMYSELETVEGQASNLGYYELLGDYQMAEEHREAIRRVTPDEIMNVARKYFKKGNCSILSYLPEDPAIKAPAKRDVEALFDRVDKAVSKNYAGKKGASSKTIGKPDKLEARTSAATRTAPRMKRLTLDTGLRVLVKRRTTIPMVSMLTMVQGGSRLEPVGKSGLTTLANRTLLKGTRSYSRDDIVGIVEGLGGSVETVSSFDVTGVYMNILTEYLDDALPVYREVLREPAFDPDIVEKEKARLLRELVKRHDHPVYLSMDELFASAFGGHPYAYPFVGDEKQLAGLTAEDCLDWHKAVLRPKNTVVVFVGDISEDKAIDVARLLVGDLEDGRVPVPEIEAPIVPVKPGLHELRRANLKQAVALVGFLAPPMMTDEAISLGVLDGIMTGLGGRLFVELRDKRSLGYMAGSSFMPLKERSIFYAYNNPGPDGVTEAIDVILTELDKVTRHPVGDDELARSKGWLTGSQTMKLQRNLAQAIEYGVYETLGYGFETVDRTPDVIRKVTKDDILKAAADVFHRDRAVMVKLTPEMKEETADKG